MTSTMIIILLIQMAYSQLSLAPISNGTIPNFCGGSPSTLDCSEICAYYGWYFPQSSGGQEINWVQCKNGTGIPCNPNKYSICSNFIWVSRGIRKTTNPAIMKIPSRSLFKISKYNNPYADKMMVITKIVGYLLNIVLKNSSQLKIGDEVVWPDFATETTKPPPLLSKYRTTNVTIFNPALYNRSKNCCQATLALNSWLMRQKGEPTGLCCETSCNCEYL